VEEFRCDCFDDGQLLGRGLGDHRQAKKEERRRKRRRRMKGEGKRCREGIGGRGGGFGRSRRIVGRATK
jgi:hypothetical protein